MLNPRNTAVLVAGAAVAMLAASCSSSSSPGSATEEPVTAAATGPRLYVMDCGTIPAMNPELYGLKPEELTGPGDFATPCYLIVHPQGTLVWDLGQIPDSHFPPEGGPVSEGAFRASKPLLPQLAEAGYTPAGIDYVVMSHYHTDHSANANSFAGSEWIVQRAERDAMFAEKAPGLTQRDNYIDLANAQTILLEGEDHDVFGDGTVVIKFTPGHTPGHQSLFVKLENYGPVVLAGDLYHYPDERRLDRVPGFDFDADMTRASRRKIDQFLEETGAELWIEHDMTRFDTLKKSPEFYD